MDAENCKTALRKRPSPFGQNIPADAQQNRFYGSNRHFQKGRGSSVLAINLKSLSRLEERVQRHLFETNQMSRFIQSPFLTGNLLPIPDVQMGARVMNSKHLKAKSMYEAQYGCNRPSMENPRYEETLTVQPKTEEGSGEPFSRNSDIDSHDSGQILIQKTAFCDAVDKIKEKSQKSQEKETESHESDEPDFFKELCKLDEEPDFAQNSFHSLVTPAPEFLKELPKGFQLLKTTFTKEEVKLLQKHLRNARYSLKTLQGNPSVGYYHSKCIEPGCPAVLTLVFNRLATGKKVIHNH
jgi:hypothetical protein